MIKTVEGLKVTREALANLESALQGLECERSRYHPKTFAVFAEPLEEDIAKLRAEIAAFEAVRPVIPALGERFADVIPVGDRS